MNRAGDSTTAGAADPPRDPDCYWVEPGRLLAGEHPGSVGDRKAGARLRALLACGIRSFIDLTEEEELPAYSSLLEQEAEAMGIAARYCRMPVPDLGVPDEHGMCAILRTIEDAISNGAPVYVHCWGGIGRTGTVVGCWLIERGTDRSEVLARLDALRRQCRKSSWPSPETPEQCAFVRDWQGTESGGS
jgi:hypothetical protein